MNKVGEFLKANGFKKIEASNYKNDRCNIVIKGWYYAITNNNGDEIYSHDLNIYWLIGVLTYYGHINKDYKQLNK